MSDSTSRAGGLVGSGFYLEQYKEYYPTPTMYRLVNCNTSGSITGGSEAIGTIAGHAHNSIIENCTSTMTINGASENVPQVGKEETGVSTPTTGILVVAHGSSEDEWNQPVRDAVEGIDCPYPVELGFLEFVEGEDIGTAVASLEEQGVEHIITVPIFVASASGHIEEIKYILGISSSITEEDAIEEGLEVVSYNAEIEITSALDDHPLVAEILDDRIATVSQQADQEIVILVAHGTSDAEDLAVWKNNLASLGQQLKDDYQFLDVDYGFVALGEPNVRDVVEAQQAENPGVSIIVMPVMLSEGTFTSTKIPEVLDGLTYIYPEEGQRSLLPHDKISLLIVARAYDAMGVFAGGNGTEESPYQIATAEQLDQVRNYLDKDFVLTADLDLSGYENWEPIGTFQPLSDDPEDEETPDPELAFTGTFNGSGYTISNLTINQPEGMAIGLFGCVAGEQEDPIHIYDLTLENADVTGNFCVGGVVGFQYADSILENINLTGDNRVQGNIYAGGILGGSDIGGGSAELRDCNAAADIALLGDAASSAGVLGGALNACSVIDCTATGTVTAKGENYFALGGLIGGVFEGIEVINCHADDVSITACGKNNTMIGGLLGYAGTYGKQPPTQITECSANVTIAVLNSTDRVGGLIGGSFYHELAAEARPVPARYAVNSCNTSGSITGGGNEVGSIAGYAYDSTVENCTSTMTINRVSENVSQVGLYESAFGGGNGTEESPYRITTAEQLDRVRYYLDKDFILTADIDLSGYENWEPIGTFDENIFDNVGRSDIAFSGTFDGNGHTVSNLTATHQDLVGVGLFGVASSDAMIKNLTVENASVTGYMSTAGIVGLNCASVENLALKGENEISGVNCIGGVLGGHGFGNVKNCTVEDVTINVLGNNDFSSGPIIQCDVAECGGLIIGGAFTGSIENCSAQGEIIAEGNEPVGLGGIGGCLEYMENITGCTADVTITAPNSAHAVGGLCGYAGTGDTENPAVIENCSVTFVMNTANATHIGGLVGTGLYYMGMETVFSINNCSTEGQINGAVTPGTIAGRAENCTIKNCTFDVLIDGVQGTAEIGTTERMYESADQPEGFEDLSAWANSGSGSFESLVNYVNDDALSDVWNTAASSEMAQMMAGMFGVNVTDGASLKAMFANMALTPANNGTQIYQIKFSSDYKTIYFCDQEGNVIESHPYTFVESNNSLGMLAGETTYVFKADDDAGVLNYIAMLKPHFDEGMDETTIPAHVHFYYAATKDTLSTYKPDSVTLSSWMPTMLQMDDEFSTTDKVPMLECLFGIDNACTGGNGTEPNP
ncbi:sirohydrochlorin chelatase [Methanosarcina sp. T3]|uniref:sirohydrochlorin chelatase n=1 Tax=Methanosarcina sp. T3 TaxID=3439062 RepID=UPI003F829711